ncbi:MAG TPA: DNA ligase, partial [Candidatus Methanomethylia archaeon]|nr:DNA ligase [Candidatus Methanomethylicia archaeon]
MGENPLKYSLLVETYERIEATTKRLEMTGYLVDLFTKSDREVIDKVIYLTQGKLYPDYLGIELGMAEKLIIRSISLAAGVSTHEIDKIFKELGDVGRTAEQA